MQITLGATGTKAAVIEQLQSPSVLTDPAEQACEDSIRATLAAFVGGIVPTDAASVGVSGTLTVSFAPATPAT